MPILDTTEERSGWGGARHMDKPRRNNDCSNKRCEYAASRRWQSGSIGRHSPHPCARIHRRGVRWVAIWLVCEARGKRQLKSSKRDACASEVRNVVRAFALRRMQSVLLLGQAKVGSSKTTAMPRKNNVEPHRRVMKGTL